MKRKFRLTQANDFKRVRHTGRSYAHPLAVIVTAKGLDQNSRAGIIATRSVGGAVERNRVKRQLRAIIAPYMPELQEPVDFLLIARERASKARFIEIQSAVVELLGKAGLIVSNHHDPGR
ncbi:MAG TPA: ribonuclease P protein component [Anaerolineaceae bacterium]|nr:ribonuclease P protein component [Anaerolineaceae bacterium]